MAMGTLMLLLARQEIAMETIRKDGFIVTMAH